MSNTLHGRVPDPVEYLRTRRRPAGTSLSTILPRYAHGRDLPAELPGHATVQALIDAFADNLDLRATSTPTARRARSNATATPRTPPGRCRPARTTRRTGWRVITPGTRRPAGTPSARDSAPPGGPRPTAGHAGPGGRRRRRVLRGVHRPEAGQSATPWCWATPRRADVTIPASAMT
ncbi:terpene synthase family protein [Kitasatospora sp. NPDC005748]|uniref:terpene synthase family protein n=1 Tax=Kitasatospora sp. NPDC005748 TaxID=3157063 RepID=UPI0033D7677C